MEIANRLLTENIGLEAATAIVNVSKNIHKNSSNTNFEGLRVIETSLRIGEPTINVVARVIYRSSAELFHITQEINKMPNISRVEWSEIVKVVGSNNTLALIGSTGWPIR